MLFYIFFFFLPSRILEMTVFTDDSSFSVGAGILIRMIFSSFLRH